VKSCVSSVSLSEIMADAQPELKAGHPPAVKAGGMRITQHKPPKEEKPKEKPEEVEEAAGWVHVCMTLVSVVTPSCFVAWYRTNFELQMVDFHCPRTPRQ
jgi:hypothetical protein